MSTETAQLQLSESVSSEWAEEREKNPFMMMSEDQMRKLDAVLSSEQVRALLQDTGKLEDVLGPVSGQPHSEGAGQSLDETFHDLENLVLDHEAAPGIFNVGAGEMEELLNSTLEEPSILDVILMDHCYCLPAETQDHQQQEEKSQSSQSEDLDSSQDSERRKLSQLPLRRSQRQIDKIDKERLEKIKAENAELQRREREEMEKAMLEKKEAEESINQVKEIIEPLVISNITPVPDDEYSVCARVFPVVLAEDGKKYTVYYKRPDEVAEDVKREEKEDLSLAEVQPKIEMDTGQIKKTNQLKNSEETMAESLPGKVTSQEMPKETPKKVKEQRQGNKMKKVKEKERKTPKKVPKGQRSPVPDKIRKRSISSSSEGKDPEKQKNLKNKNKAEAPMKMENKPKLPKQEHKKKLVRTDSRSLSFSENFEPALFSQPDVLTKEQKDDISGIKSPFVKLPDLKQELAENDLPAMITRELAEMDRLAKQNKAAEKTPVVAKTEKKIERSKSLDGVQKTFSPDTVTKVVKHEKSQIEGAVVKTPKNKPSPLNTEGVKQEKIKPDSVHPSEKSKLITKGQKVEEKTPKSKLPLPSPSVGVKSDALPLQNKSKLHIKPKAEGNKPDFNKDQSSLKTMHKQAPKTPDVPSQKLFSLVKQEKSQKEQKHNKKESPSEKKLGKESSKQKHHSVKGTKVKKDSFEAKVKTSETRVSDRPERSSKEKFKEILKAERQDEMDEELIDDPGDSDWSSEDDPEKLWCICRQPHNDKFMIQCDKCQDWFHGNCVGVTRQEGRQLEKEKREWVCPKCIKGISIVEEKKPVKKEIKIVERPRKTSTSEEVTKVTQSAGKDCLVCKKKCVGVNIYCSRECITKYTESALLALKNHQSKDDKEKRIVVTERSSGKMLSGPQADAQALIDWLAHNPTYEILLPKQRTDSGSSQQKEPQSATVTTTSTAPTSSNNTTTAVKETSKKPETESGPEPVRLNVRKTLRDTLAARCKDADDILLSSEEIKRIAVKIEEELYRYFKDTGTKYKSKYRSLVFNIKDTRNQGLFRKILKGKIPPDKLVRMTPEELASKELAKWRERENQHMLEMIKKEQLEEQNVSHRIKKTHKGEVEIDDDNLALLEKGPEKPKTETDTHSSIAAASPLDTTDSHKSHLFDLNCKICTGKMAPPPPEEQPPAKKVRVAHSIAVESRSSPDTKDTSLSSTRIPDTIINLPPAPKSKDDSSDHEPSSTVSIGSPDSGHAKRSSSQKMPTSVWKGFISMQEVAKFVTSAYKVSGPTDFLSQDIPDTINVCGRIIPEQVWDYLSKIKQSGNKELLIIRFQPANDEEKLPYKTLYSYLNARKRCGVVGGLSKMIKDFYILPLPSHSPVPTVLMPFDGPGLDSGRSHLLLGVIVRHRSKPQNRSSVTSNTSLDSVVSPTATGVSSVKISRNIDRPEPSYTPPLESLPHSAESSSHTLSPAARRSPVSDDEPYEPSYTPPLEERPSHSLKEADDDKPYDPEENEVDFAGGLGETLASSTTSSSVLSGSSYTGQEVTDLLGQLSKSSSNVTSTVLASITSNTDLEQQKRLLMELTQKVEEQKQQIEQQRLQALKLSSSLSSTSIPFLETSASNKPVESSLSFLSSVSAPAQSSSSSSSSSCTLPSTLQELLNTVKKSTAKPQEKPTSSKTLVTDEDLIVKQYRADALKPPGSNTPTNDSPGTPTKDELVVEEMRPQDPRRRSKPPSKIGSLSASELMEKARKQLEEVEELSASVVPSVPTQAKEDVSSAPGSVASADSYIPSVGISSGPQVIPSHYPNYSEPPPPGVEPVDMGSRYTMPPVQNAYSTDINASPELQSHSDVSHVPPIHELNHIPPPPMEMAHVAPPPIDMSHLPPPPDMRLPPPDMGHLAPPDMGHLGPPEMGRMPPDMGHMPPHEMGHMPPPDMAHLPPLGYQDYPVDYPQPGSYDEPSYPSHLDQPSSHHADDRWYWHGEQRQGRHKRKWVDFRDHPRNKFRRGGGDNRWRNRNRWND